VLERDRIDRPLAAGSGAILVCELDAVDDQVPGCEQQERILHLSWV
jgi:hypothetical protein